VLIVVFHQAEPPNSVSVRRGPPWWDDHRPSRRDACAILTRRGGPNLKLCVVGRNKVAMIKKLLHTRYRVTDLEKTVSFYRDVLGLEEVRRHTSGRGSQLVFLKAPGSDVEIEICKFDDSGPVMVGPDLTHLAFEVDNIEEFAKRTAAKGYPLSDGPHPNGRGGAIAFIDAPEGYEIELIQRGGDR
jgi:lactoylglutathione lyase